MVLFDSWKEKEGKKWAQNLIKWAVRQRHVNARLRDLSRTQVLFTRPTDKRKEASAINLSIHHDIFTFMWAARRQRKERKKEGRNGSQNIFLNRKKRERALQGRRSREGTVKEAHYQSSTRTAPTHHPCVCVSWSLSSQRLFSCLIDMSSAEKEKDDALILASPPLSIQIPKVWGKEKKLKGYFFLLLFSFFPP